jgi:hypothetical protein
MLKTLEWTSPFQVVTNKMKKNISRKWMEQRNNKVREMARFLMYYSNRIASSELQLYSLFCRVSVWLDSLKTWKCCVIQIHFVLQCYNESFLYWTEHILWILRASAITLLSAAAFFEDMMHILQETEKQVSWTKQYCQEGSNHGKYDYRPHNYGPHHYNFGLWRIKCTWCVSAQTQRGLNHTVIFDADLM